MMPPDEEPRGGFLAWLAGPLAAPSPAPWPSFAGALATAAILALAIAAATFVLALAMPARSAAAARDPLVVGLWLAVMQATTVLLVWRAAVARAGRETRMDAARALALVAPRGGRRDFVFALAGLVVLLAPYNVVLYLISPETLLGDLRPYAEMMRHAAWPLIVVVIGIGAPLSEELLIRGLLLPALATSPLRFEGAAAISTVAWTMLHAGYSLAGLIEVFLIGVYFAWLLWRTGSLLVPIACHAIYNTALILALKILPFPA